MQKVIGKFTWFLLNLRSNSGPDRINRMLWAISNFLFRIVQFLRFRVRRGSIGSAELVLDISKILSRFLDLNCRRLFKPFRPLWLNATVKVFACNGRARLTKTLLLIELFDISNITPSIYDFGPHFRTIPGSSWTFGPGTSRNRLARRLHSFTLDFLYSRA